MTVLLYRRDPSMEPALALPMAPLPPGIAARIWRPACDGFPRHASFRGQDALWRAMDKAGLFASRGFAEIGLWAQERLVHRLILTPRWYRFAFMGNEDLQIGAVWTAPAFRRRGLALAGVSLALRMGHQRALWYVCDAENLASIRLAERSGFVPAGRAVRSAPFGVRLAGRYRRAGPD